MKCPTWGCKHHLTAMYIHCIQKTKVATLQYIISHRLKSIHSEKSIMYFVMGKYMYLYIQNGGEEKMTRLEIYLYVFYLLKCPYIHK